MQINDFLDMKQKSIPIKMVTCYDFWTANIIANTNIDSVLIGDSAAMVMYGYESTINADTDMLVSHIKAVKRGIGDKFIVGDLAFLTYRKSLKCTMKAVEETMKAGAHAIKLEGVTGNEDVIEHIVNSGVPVMGHLGFTPQSVNMFGKNIVQGKSETQGNIIKQEAKKLESLGCFSLVLECVPANLAKDITESISIPTIGIGAGQHTSGQILVLQDLLGADPKFTPKFLKKYANIFDIIKDAVNEYCAEVDSKEFPTIEHSFKESKNANS